MTSTSSDSGPIRLGVNIAPQSLKELQLNNQRLYDKTGKYFSDLIRESDPAERERLQRIWKGEEDATD